MIEQTPVNSQLLASFPESIAEITGKDGEWFVQTGNSFYAAAEFDLASIDQSDPVVLALRCIEPNSLLRDPASYFDAFESETNSPLQQVIYWDSEGGRYYTFNPPLRGAGFADHWYKDEFIDRIKTCTNIRL